MNDISHHIGLQFVEMLSARNSKRHFSLYAYIRVAVAFVVVQCVQDIMEWRSMAF